MPSRGLGELVWSCFSRRRGSTLLLPSWGAQFVGSIVTILARATNPDKIGSGEVFPDFSEGVMPDIGKPGFWIALLMQLVLPFGYFKIFREEQVAKP